MVNAVDANWNPVHERDAIPLVLTCSDNQRGAAVKLPPLSAGTGSFSVTMKTAGSRTVTATDITDGTKTANSSPAITVNSGAFVNLQLLAPGETAVPGLRPVKREHQRRELQEPLSM